MAARFDTGSFESYGAVEATGTNITVPDANLLFTGDFSRSGTDLTITGSEGAKFVVAGYFNSDNPPSLLSPEGAMLTGDVVSSLAGPQFPGQYAQAGGGGQTGQEAIGKVQTLDGSATVVRANGTTETLKNGDPVFQGDVVSTGPGSKLGIGFVDGTVFSLSANARMVLNSLIYNPDGKDNSMLFSLVEGTFVFAAGQIAPNGDMKINTPVATMGIRGTAPTVNIDSATGKVNFSIIPDPGDGHVGSYTLYSLDTGQPIGTISTVGTKWQITSATGQVTEVEKTQEDLLNDAEAIGQINNVFNTYQTNSQGPQAGPENSPPSSSGLDTTPSNPGTTGGDNSNPGTQGGGDNPPPQGDGENENTPPPPPPTNNDDPPPPPPEATGPNIITGSENTDVLNGTDGVDHFFALGGNDFIFASQGDDEIDGGEGTDTGNYQAATQNVVFNLVTGEINSEDFGFDTFASLERFLAGEGNDTFIFAEDTGWFFDGGEGFDTIQVVGDIDIDTSNFNSDAENIEAIDLNKTDANVLTISVDAAQNDDGETILQIRGGTNADNTTDTVNLTPEMDLDDYEGEGEYPGAGYYEGSWVKVEGETFTAPDGTVFDLYEFISDDIEIPIASVHIEQGIDVTLGQTVVADGEGEGEIVGPLNVGYYDATDGQGDPDQIGPITAAGHNAVNIAIPNAASLVGIQVLFLQVENNSAYGAEFLSNLPAIHQAVAAGMTLIIHDRFVDNAEYILPGSEGFNIIRNFTDDADIDVLDPNSTVTDGPGGVVNDSTLDGGNSSTHGFAIQGSLPEDAELVLSTGDESNIVTFSYSFGEGNVIYSTIPLDFYLNGNGPTGVSSNFRDIYAPNVVDYGAELAADGELAEILLGGPGNDILVGGEGNTVYTGGLGADKFILSNLGDGLNTITDYGPLDSLDLSAILVDEIGPVEDIGTVITDYIQAITDGNGNTVISVDADGTENGSEFTPLAVLQGVGAGADIAVTIGDEHTTVESVAANV